MFIFDFDIQKTFTFRWCGKFQSPTPEWMHFTRQLYDYELMVVTKGTLYIGSETKRYEVKEGQYLLMEPTKCQYGYQSSDCSFYWMHFLYNGYINDRELHDSETLTEVYCQGHLLIPEEGSLTSPERIIILLRQLQDSDQRYRESGLNNYLASAALAELANQSYLFKKYGKGNMTKQLYNDICDYITLHANENLTLEELADYFSYNKKYLTTFFRNKSGITIKQYMLQTKMDRAKGELTDTNHPIAQVAYNIGFSDVHNFSNAFKKITGLSPTNYRNSFSKRYLNNK